MEEKEELKRLYQLYLTNGCTAEELQRFFVLIDNSKDDETILELMSASWDQTQRIPETGLVPDFLPKETKQIKLSPAHRIRYGIRSVAAAAAILLICAGLFFFRSTLWNAISPAHQLQSFSAQAQRKQLELSDGTKVWLSPNSTLKYPDKFVGNSRMIALEGEAFFEVAHDASHPFIIQSGQVSTRVLGTSFNISAYQQNQNISVTLVTGKVAVALQKENSIMEETIVANQQVTINKAEEKISKANFPNASDYLNRRLGHFDYKGTALAEVVKDLELQYQIKIQLSPELNKNLFCGHIHITNSPTHTINKLCTLLYANCKKDGVKYVILK
jgi:transmembrane sensor